MIYFYLLGLIIVLYGASVDMNYLKRKKKFIIIVSSLLILFSGLRNIYWGPDDTYNYYILFEKLKDLDYAIIPIVQLEDTFYSIFCKFAGTLLGGSFRLYLFFVSFLFVGSIGILIYKYSPKVLLSYLIFLSLFYSLSMVLIRQCIAISILTFSYKYLVSRKFFKFILIVLIATLFHKTAFVFFIAYPLTYFKFDWKMLLVYSVICILAIVYGNSLIHSIPQYLLDDRMTGYMGSDNTLSWAGFIQLLLFACLTLVYKKQAIVKYPRIEVLYHLLFIAIIFQTGTAIIAEFFRISLYFNVFLVILVPQVLASIHIQVDKKLVVNTLSALLLLYYFLSNIEQDFCFLWEQYEPKFILTD